MTAGVFKEADIHLADTDLCMFIPVLEQQASGSMEQDTLHIASDIGGVVNSRLISLLRALPDEQRQIITGDQLEEALRSRRLLTRRNVERLVSQKTPEPLAKTLAQFQDSQYVIETPEAAAAIRVASVWGPVGFERIRVRTAEDIILVWMLWALWHFLVASR